MADDMKTKPDSYWKEKLTPEQYRVLREKGTEVPGSGEFVDHDEAGIYTCAACGQELFSSDTKYESSLPGLVGWPAFYAEAAKGNIELKDDSSMGMHRTEIVCARCGSHLGHLFEGDPAVEDKGGKHYCVNSCALEFKGAKS
ncbi:MAG: Peptide methionine sulfoxide reductase MsrB [Candidatus Saccharibacteria bacterium]|jgi:peptide-methionine (R)-S-oxide reductase|nr:Peptide methionine sulfoxide reductase MsrB [Candidatus Saccharibacteria bacterium]